MVVQSDLLDELKKTGIQRSYRTGENVFLYNEPATGMYLVLHGEAQVMLRNPEGVN